MRLSKMNVNEIQHQNTILLLFYQLRPKQWTKNLLVISAILFTPDNLTIQNVFLTFLGFFLFCFVSSSVYILNDFVDREADSQHPTKRYRPMASGALNPYFALSFGVFLLCSSLVTSFYINPLFTLLLSFYFTMNVAYSFKLKHVVIIDVMIIALGFVFRAIAGGLVINVPLTPWFIICTMFLSLFLAIGKRRNELILLESSKGNHRKVLDSYSPSLIDQLNSIVTSGTIISYSLFTFTSGHTVHLMWTLPFVIYGVFRYLYLIHIKKQGGAPEKILLDDKPILLTVILYGISVVVILGIFE